MSFFPPLDGPDRFNLADSWTHADQQDTVKFADNPAGLADAMTAQRQHNSADTSVITAEPLLRGEAGGRHILALAVVVLGLIIGTPVAYSVMTPSTGTSSNAAPAVTPSETPLPVAPPPSAAPGANGSNGSQGSPGADGVTTVIYVPVSSSQSGSGSTTSAPRPKPVATKAPAPAPTTAPAPRPTQTPAPQPASNQQYPPTTTDHPAGYASWEDACGRSGDSAHAALFANEFSPHAEDPNYGWMAGGSESNVETLNANPNYRGGPYTGWRQVTYDQCVAYGHGASIPQI